MNDEQQPSATPLPTPRALRQQFPASAEALALIAAARATIRSILAGRDDRLLVVVGPCSIHDRGAALDYAERLAELARAHADELFVCMRSYFEKPRTTIGWKGLLNDPRLDGSCDLAAGLRLARELLSALCALGLPPATEALDPLAQGYLADLVAWSAIGARTTESQTHRELASGLPMPIGFKNGTDGGIQVAIRAMRASARPHTMLGLNEHGQASVVRSPGNPHTHLVLRGGASGANYTRTHVERAQAELRSAGLSARVMVDCSHDNSQGDHRNQRRVVDDLATQVARGSHAIGAVMIESHLIAGRQQLGEGDLVYGQSITDACVDFATTEQMLARLARAVRSRRALDVPSSLAAE